MKNIKTFDTVNIVQRDSFGIPYESYYYPFIAEIPGSIIYMVSKNHFKYKSPEDELLSIVRGGEGKDIYATLYRAESKDCYASRREAEAAINKERKELLRRLQFCKRLWREVFPP